MAVVLQKHFPNLKRLQKLPKTSKNILLVNDSGAQVRQTLISGALGQGLLNTVLERTDEDAAWVRCLHSALLHVPTAASVDSLRGQDARNPRGQNTA